MCGFHYSFESARIKNRIIIVFIIKMVISLIFDEFIPDYICINPTKLEVEGHESIHVPPFVQICECNTI